ncbi:DUF4180 domain-containing protein [Nonomuraea sp. NPDC004580]|uniref:DUF4180 domain-containing protein n=1 Tax=Nonomuraea sp. NPDC004580 TaxID=3154552 RepID=UPI0033AEC4B2
MTTRERTPMPDVHSYDGPPLAEVRDVLDLIGEAWSSGATWVAVPADRLPAAFFTLSTGVAGEIAQKFVNYRIGLSIVGDISRHLETGSALRAWVEECNSGHHIWFVPDAAELTSRLTPR